MAKPTKKTATRKRDGKDDVVSDPQAEYTRKNPRRTAVKRSKEKPTEDKPYDAQKFAGAFPGIADWYVDSLRDEARQTMDKADHLSKVMLRSTKRDKQKKDDTRTPGIIDVDRFSGVLPHLKGDAVRTQRKLRDEA